jgi:membrane-bound lytic murein transglycosylase D
LRRARRIATLATVLGFAAFTVRAAPPGGTVPVEPATTEPASAEPAPQTQSPDRTPPATVDDSNPFPRPPDLERDVRFWIRVYTEVTTDGGLLHDSWNLGLVYEVLRFEPEQAPQTRERLIAAAKARYAALLRRFAAGDKANLSAHELRILHAFGGTATPSDFLAAIDRIRFQLGQADRFHEGLIRAEVLERRIAQTLKANGVPPEIAALPHVESSFNAFAYSRVGAAGLWQFMPKTARRYMRVDDLVDERLDPFRATEAAANLMLYNYRLVGTWPLAVTAYNHGPGGLRRAQDELGSSDIAVIVKHYNGATFGFASRNFYVAFLAALEVDRNAEKFFGPITRLPDPESMTVELPDYIAVEAIAKAFKVDPGALRVLNPALLPPIWSGARLVPRGYAVRVPGKWTATDIAAAWDRVPPNQRYLAQRSDPSYRVRRAESLEAVARRTGLPVARLLAANGWTVAPPLQKGQIVRLPPPATRADRGESQGATLAEASPHTALPHATSPEPPPPAAPASATTAGKPVPAPLVVAQAERRPSLLPAATPSGNADTTNYAVEKGDTVIVQAAETLGYLADWSDTNADELRKLNHLRRGSMVALGHKLKLDFSRNSAEVFEARRRAYHRELQETYFAAHRIAATENYTIKRGDSLWTIAHSHGDLPIWLVTQYNPDADFTDMRPGTSISLPTVESINRQ